MRELLADFRKFINRGNLIDLAVAVIIGLAIKAVIDSLVNDVIMPIVGILFGEPSFDDLTITINDSVIRYGTFITALVNFLIVAFVVFMIIKAWEKMQELRASGEDEPEPLTVSEELLAEIRDLLRDGQAGSAPGGSSPPPPV